EHDLDAACQAPSVEPGAVAAVIHNEKLSPGGIAAETQVLARDLLLGVERKVHAEIVAAASDRDFALGDVIGLWPGIILIADLGEDALGRVAGGAARSGSGPGAGPDGRLAIQQRRFCAAEAGLRGFVQLRVDLDVTLRHDALGIGKKLEAPVPAGDLVLLTVLLLAEQGGPAVQLGEAGVQGLAGVIFDEVLHRTEPRVVLGMQVNVEDAREKDAIPHFEVAHFAVADELVENGLAADAGRRRFQFAVCHAYKSPSTPQGQSSSKRTRNW